MNKTELSRVIKSKAADLGFLSCGISKVKFLEAEARHLENWLKADHHGQMAWMERNFDKRVDPSKLVENAKSVISVLLNYFPEREIFEQSVLRISKYAYGEDYHHVIKDRLETLLGYMKDTAGEINGRFFVDSAPVLDKAWAERSGLGWIGKNANLISTKAGSFFFIGEIICDLELEYDQPALDHCGTCTRCIDACPTEAIIKPQVVDARKCISYLTIELKDEMIPSGFQDKMENWIFGCDICQDVCPWNRFSVAHKVSEFTPLNGLEKSDLFQLTAKAFDTIFKTSAIRRTGHAGLMRNIRYIKEKEA